MLNLICSTIGTYQQVELDQCETTWHLISSLQIFFQNPLPKLYNLGFCDPLSHIDEVMQMGISIDRKLSLGFCWNFFAIFPW
jgi:hypothetical protein